MTTTIPSFEEYRDARYILDHPLEFADGDAPGAHQTIAEFETAVRDAVSVEFRDPRKARFMPDSIPDTVLPAWCDMASWLHDALFDAAMAGARAAQGGAR